MRRRQKQFKDHTRIETEEIRKIWVPRSLLVEEVTEISRYAS